MCKILIADSNPIICKEVKQILDNAYQVYTCQDPEALPELLNTVRPEILVLDMMLPGCDGIELIKTANAAGIRPQIIATCVHYSEFLIYMLQTLHVSHFMTKPCSSRTIVGRIMDLQWYQNNDSANPDKLRQEIASVLTSLGFVVYSNGGKCLVEAIVCFLRDPAQSITKELYPAVAMICGGSPARVERAIREAIQKAWENRDETIWRLFFPAARNGSIPHMCNTDFIARMAFYLHSARQEPEIAQNM